MSRQALLRPGQSHNFLIAAPILGGIWGDAILLFRFSPETWDAALVGTLAAQAVLQTLAFFGVCAALYAVAQWPCAVGRWTSRGRSACIVVGACVGLWVFDRLAYGPTFTGHWSLRGVRLVAAAGSLCILGIRVLRPNAFVSQRSWLTLFGVAIGMGVLAVCVVFGGSLFPLAPKYLRESVHVLILESFATAWLLFVLSSPPLGFKRSFAVFGAGCSLFVCGAAAAALLSFRSSYVVVTTSECVRSLRNANRHLVRLLHLDAAPGLSAYVGSQKTPLPGPFLDSPSVACRRAGKGRAKSVLILSFDALRADFYGVPEQQRPNFERFRAESLDFTDAIQTGSGTSESIFAFHVGRYPNEASPTRDLLPTLSRDLKLRTQLVFQGWDESGLQFAEQILALVRASLSASEDFVLHAHFITLHMPAGMARSHHHYPTILRQLDAGLGRVLDGLTELGLVDKAMVIVTADHGEELLKERGYESHGYGNTQTLLHTPLFVRIPGIAPARREELVSGVDVMPTILDTLGLVCNYDLHGQSLLRGGPRGPGGPVFGHSMGPGPAVASLLFYSDIHSVFLGSWKLVLNRAENAIALYDLKTDPNEHVNLADREPAHAMELGLILDRHLSGRPPDYEAHQSR